MSFESLPKELVVEIFSWLDKTTLLGTASLVCKYWLDLIKFNPRLSGQLTLQWSEESFKIIENLNERFPEVRTITLKHYRYLDASWIQIRDLKILEPLHLYIESGRFQNYPKLESFICENDLEGIEDNNLGMKITLNKCKLPIKDLKAVDKEKLYPVVMSVSWHLYTRHLFSFEKMKGCFDFCMLESLTIKCPNRKSQVYPDFNEAMLFVIRSAKSLKHISLIDFRNDELNFIKKAIKEVIKNCPKVNSIMLRGGKAIQADRFGLCFQVAKLKKLELCGFNELDLGSFQVNENLKILNLVNCDYNEIGQLRRVFPKLTRLKITHCKGTLPENVIFDLTELTQSPIFELRNFEWKSMESNLSMELWIGFIQENKQKLMQLLQKTGKFCSASIEIKPRSEKSHFNVEKLIKENDKTPFQVTKHLDVNDPDFKLAKELDLIELVDDETDDEDEAIDFSDDDDFVVNFDNVHEGELVDEDLEAELDLAPFFVPFHG